MPHVIVKLWPGKSEEQKKRLAEAITKSVMNILHYGEESVSVVKPNAWVGEVYTPEIKNRLFSLQTRERRSGKLVNCRADRRQLGTNRKSR
jgi:4-oxalocrotonate tautomerase